MDDLTSKLHGARTIGSMENLRIEDLGPLATKRLIWKDVGTASYENRQRK
jgi:hypothetical protein